jgi:hypothetical protein
MKAWGGVGNESVIPAAGQGSQTHPWCKDGIVQSPLMGRRRFWREGVGLWRMRCGQRCPGLESQKRDKVEQGMDDEPLGSLPSEVPKPHLDNLVGKSQVESGLRCLRKLARVRRFGSPHAGGRYPPPGYQIHIRTNELMLSVHRGSGRIKRRPPGSVQGKIRKNQSVAMKRVCLSL